jgi:hypothetical protein
MLHFRRGLVADTLHIRAYGGDMTKTATPWGPAAPVERLVLQQRAGDRRFSSLVELLETDAGERLVRFAYATDGKARRGPVTLRERDLERLRDALAKTPALRELLGLG